MATGTFLCVACSARHNRVKGITNEHWDDSQLITVQEGGNKKFLDFLREYDMVDDGDGVTTFQQVITDRYTNEAVIFYVRRLKSIVDGQIFTEVQPSKDWDESYSRAKTAVKDWLQTTDKKVYAL